MTIVSIHVKFFYVGNAPQFLASKMERRASTAGVVLKEDEGIMK